MHSKFFLSLIGSHLLAVMLCGAQPATRFEGKYDAFPSDIPATFEPVEDRFDFTRRKVMISMRDGVKLHTVILYQFALPTANHVFLPDHRIMVQVQSSWFPLYDRNPQTYVTNIFWAKPDDYRKAVQRVYHSPNCASFIELPLVAP